MLLLLHVVPGIEKPKCTMKKKACTGISFPLVLQRCLKTTFVKYFQVILSKTDTLESNATQVNNFFQKIIDNIRECSRGFLYT